MNERFDPYYTWLGIPPGEQPPSHYRLLGIQDYEPNPKVIDNAADRQMMHLRSFQNGPQSSESQRLLNEVATARICLQDVSRKAVYDGQLRQNATAGHSTVASAIDQIASTAAVVPRNIDSRGTKKRSTTTRNATLEIAKIVVGGIAGLVVAVLVIQ